MKKILMIALLCTFSYMTVSAQDVYKEILRISKKGAADETKGLELRRIFQFKVDELNYMLMKTREQMPDSSMHMVDTQAYAMYDFVNSYLKDISKKDKKKDKELIKTIYKEATIHNSRFNDMDKDLVLSYYNREDYITQFSLDTDWIKAMAEVKRVLSNL
jgi:hypothetical protein